MLSGKRVRFVIKRSAFSIGRPTSSHGVVSAPYPSHSLLHFTCRAKEACAQHSAAFHKLLSLI